MCKGAMITHHVQIRDLLASSVPKMHSLGEAVSSDDVFQRSDEFSKDSSDSLDFIDLHIGGTEDGVVIQRDDGTELLMPWVYLRCSMLHVFCAKELAARGIAADDKVQVLVLGDEQENKWINVDLNEILGPIQTALRYLPLIKQIADTI